jgi:hypothetical protein
MVLLCFGIQRASAQFDLLSIAAACLLLLRIVV